MLSVKYPTRKCNGIISVKHSARLYVKPLCTILDISCRLYAVFLHDKVTKQFTCLYNSLTTSGMMGSLTYVIELQYMQHYGKGAV